MARRRRNNSEDMTAWPGYVDALSTLLMVIIFVLLVFVLAQAFLSVALAGRDKALASLTDQVSQLADTLALQKGKATSLQDQLAQMTQALATSQKARGDLADQLAAATARTAALSARTAALAASTADLKAQRTALRMQLADATTALSASTSKSQATGQQVTQLTQQLATTQQTLAQKIAEAKAMAALVDVDKATISARLGDLAKLADEVRRLAALRDSLAKQAMAAAAAAGKTKPGTLDAEKLSETARAQLALVDSQIAALRTQLAQIGAALDAAEQDARNQNIQITTLGSRLNAALAAKVEELRRYRSQFFAQLSKVLAGRPGIEVVGDRFVFQSEVLFTVGSAELSPDGAAQIDTLASTVKQLMTQIPPDVNWILQVNGYADKQKIIGGPYQSNWELSAARAITVVKRLIADGVSPEHLAAAAFSDYQPIAKGNTPADYAKNRRIELRLTDQ